MDHFPSAYLINYVERAAPTSASTASLVSPAALPRRCALCRPRRLGTHRAVYRSSCENLSFPPTSSPRDSASSDPIAHRHCRRSSIAAVVTVATAAIAALPSRWPLLPPLPPSANVAPLQPSSPSFSPFPRSRCHPPRVSQSHRTCSVASFAVYTDKADELIPKSKTAERDMGFERPQAATPSRF